jgi:pre-mRNA-splicing factor SYF1
MCTHDKLIMLLDNAGTVDTCRAAYERVIDLKVATAQMCLNYASYLEEHDYFEDSFRVYEKAVSMYTFPQLKIIWLTYLDKFMARYSGTKLERLRDLFEQSLTEAPEDCAAELYMKYGKAEEEYGLARHAMAVYDRACRAVPEARRLDMYRLYIRKVEQYFGVTKTRPIYERAISELSDDHSRQICVEFADMERKLGEVDRARAIWQHGSQFADPRKEPQYWARWKSFEEAHGNEDTFRDMLRVQRSVEAAFSQVNYLAAEMLAGTGGDAPEAGLGVGAAAPVGGLDSMAMQAEQSAIARAQEQEASMESNKRKFVKASDQENFEPSKRAALTDTEEIDIDGEGEGEEGERPAPMDFSQKPVPAAVFGSLESS